MTARTEGQEKQPGKRRGSILGSPRNLIIASILGAVVLIVTTSAQWYGSDLREQNQRATWSRDNVLAGQGRIVLCKTDSGNKECKLVQEAKRQGPQIKTPEISDNLDVPAVRFDK